MSLQVGLRDINQRLTEYIQMVEQGEEIVITRRGKPIAKLTPFSESSALSDAQRASLRRSLARAKKGFKFKEKTFSRDDIYDRD